MRASAATTSTESTSRVSRREPREASILQVPCVLGKPGSRARPHELRRRGDLHPPPPGSKSGLDFTAVAPAAQSVDTLRVLGLRISFREDRSGSKTSVTADGNFDFRTGIDDVYDPPPRNRAYFQSQLEALRRFYWEQSGGRLFIDYQVAPSDPGSSYKVSDLADYGPGSYDAFDIEVQQVRWETFMRDALAAADAGMAAESYRLSDFDRHVVFHAGGDLQGDINGDSPNDLPSFTIFFPDSGGVPIDGGTDSLYVAALIPETVSQDGFGGGLMGTLCHEFGHLGFGLADLYNTVYGWPEVGVWALMGSGNLVSIDAGFGPGEGLLAPSFNIFHKFLLGWVDPVVVSSFQQGLELLAAESRSPGTKAVLLDVSPTEYFIIENRQAEVDGLPTFLRADSTGVVLGPVNCTNCPVSGGGSFDLVPSPEYDVGLPTYGPDGEVGSGPGVLIWHIDEFKYFTDLFFNQVQIGTRAVALEEASGVEDLGDPTSPLIFGWGDDPFFAGNNSRFADNTLPASWANNRSRTHFTVENITVLDTLMTFDAGNLRVPAGWPKELGSLRALGEMSLGFLRFAGESAAGLCLWDSTGILDRYTFDGVVIDTALVNLGSPIVFPQAYSDRYLIGASTEAGIAVAERDGTLHVFRADASSTGPFGLGEHSGWPRSLAAGIRFHPVLAEQSSGTILFAVDVGDNLYRFTSGVTQPITSYPVALDSIRTPPALIDVDADGVFEVAVVAGERLEVLDAAGDDVPGFPVSIPLSGGAWSAPVHLRTGNVDADDVGLEEAWVVSGAGEAVLVFANGSLATEEPVRLEGALTGSPMLIDLGGDRDLELVYATAELIGARTRNGATARDWPRHLSRVFPLESFGTPQTPLTGIPLDERDGPEILFGGSLGEAYLLDTAGRILPGWPALVDFTLTGPLLSADLDADQRREIYTMSRFGRLSVWEMEVAAADVGPRWEAAFGDPQRSSRAVPVGSYVSPAFAGTDLNRDVVIYPNPAREEYVRVHYTAIPNSEVEVTIYSVEGEQVHRASRLHGQGAGGQAELEWNCGGVASGIYLCHFEVRSGGEGRQTVKRIAVVR